MKNVSILKISALVLFGLIICHIAYFWPKLPDSVACHFGANFEPNGWMSRDAFMYTYAGLVGLIAVSFLGGIPILKHCPEKWINLPKKDYWLAPERREQTLDALAVSMIRIHNISQTFMVAIMHMVIEYNVSKTPFSGNLFWTLFVMYCAYMVYWTVMLMIKYSRVPAENE